MKTFEEWKRNSNPTSNLSLMEASGARVSPVQIQAMMLGRGDIVTPSGDVHVAGNLRDGMSVEDYLQTARSGRMSLASNSEVVPESGYLYRQILTVVHDITVTRLAVGGDHPEGLIIDGYGPIAQDDLPHDLSTGKLHPLGCRVGLIAAMTICEKLTQAALSQKHSSGSRQHGSIGMLDATLSPLVRFKQLLSDVNAWRVLIERNDDGTPELDNKGKVIPIITKDENNKRQVTRLGLLESYEIFRDLAWEIIKVEEVHLMILFRGFTEVLESGALRSEMGTDENDSPIICGLTMLPLKFGRLLKSLRYGYTSQSMKQSILEGETKPFLDSERVMIGMMPSLIQTKRGF